MVSIPIVSSFGGVYGTIYYQAGVASNSFVALAVHIHVSPDSCIAGRARASDLQSTPGRCGASRPACALWFGSASLSSVSEMVRQLPDWRLWLFFCHQPGCFRGDWAPVTPRLACYGSLGSLRCWLEPLHSFEHD